MKSLTLIPPEEQQLRYKKATAFTDIDEHSTNDEIVIALMLENIFKTVDGVIYRYEEDEGIFVPDGDEFIRSRLEHDNVLPNITKNRKLEIITKLKDRTRSKREDFDALKDLLHVKNGWINLETGEFSKHSPKIPSLHKIPVPYIMGAKCPKIFNFLQSTLEPEQLARVLRMAAYCLLPSSKYERAFILVGEGANGKSTTINLIKNLVGKENCSSISLQDLTSDRFAKAELYGKKVNLFADLRPDKVRTGEFKPLVSGDRIRAQKKYGQPFEFENTAKLIFATNDMPEMEDDGYGNFRRLMIIPFNRTFEGETRDVDLIEKISTEDELSGFLYWLVIMLRQLKRERGFPHSDINEIKRQYQLAAGKIQDFMDEYCILDANLSVSASDMKNAYKDYCYSKGSSFINERELGKKLSSIGIEHKQKRVNRKPTWCYVGIGLRRNTVTGDNDTTLQDFSKVVNNNEESPVTTVTSTKQSLSSVVDAS